MKFDRVKHLRDLVWYDGPLLELYEMDDKKYLVLWADIVNKQHVWYVFEISNENLEKYYGRTMSLLEVMGAAPGIYVGEGIFLGPDAPELQLKAFSDIPEDTHPTPDSYHDSSLEPDWND